MNAVHGFFRFWYDFVVGDDWRIAATVVSGLVATYVLAHTVKSAWWLMPVVVILALGQSLWRVAHPVRQAVGPRTPGGR